MNSDDSEQLGSDDESEESWFGYSSDEGEDLLNRHEVPRLEVHEEDSNPLNDQQEAILQKMRV